MTKRGEVMSESRSVRPNRVVLRTVVSGERSCSTLSVATSLVTFS